MAEVLSDFVTIAYIRVDTQRNNELILTSPIVKLTTKLQINLSRFLS